MDHALFRANILEKKVVPFPVSCAIPNIFATTKKQGSEIQGQ
jgi:hypothetical protein